MDKFNFVRISKELSPSLGKPLLNMLRTHLVGWHLLQREAEDPTESTLQPQPDQDQEIVVKNFTAKVAMVHHELHSEGFFTWLVGEDDHNSSVHVIQVDQVPILRKL